MKKIKYLFLITLTVLITSCSKQLDINSNPNKPVDLSENVLLPRIEKYLAHALAIGGSTDEENVVKGAFGTNLSVYMHQVSNYGDADQYGALSQDTYWTNGWDILYRDVVTNCNSIIENGTESGNLVYVGIAKIIKAYAFSVLVDLYGEVPFSESNQLTNGIMYPKYDKGEDVYPQLFTLLNEGITDLKNTEAANVNVPSADDLIYGGDAELWTKAANSIKLKLLVQQRKIKDVATDVNALISEGNLITSAQESFMIPFGPLGATDDRNPGFSEYYATQRTLYPSPWIYEIMKGYNTTILSGIKDPRIPYYFYNQMTAEDAPSDIVEYRDGGFVSIYFGSLGPNKGKNINDVVSLLGIYPVGGRYDDGQGGVASASSGTGAAPYRLITYADILFLKAELIHEGIVTGDEAKTLEDAIKESFKMVDLVVANSQTSQSVPVLSASEDESSYVKSVMAQFSSASAAKKLEHIMTQKWLSSIGSWIDQYNDYRRTGYPKLFDPNALPGKLAVPRSGGNGGANLDDVPVTSSLPFPLSLPFINDEINQNMNAPDPKGDLSKAKVFWMP